MSHDLGFFSFKKNVSTEEIREAYLHSCEGGAADWPSSPEFHSFVHALEEKYPEISTYSDDDVDNCPWSCDFDKGDGYVIVSMVFSRAEEIGNYVWDLIQQYPVIVYDPQSDKAYWGEDEIPESTESPKWWQFWK